MSKVRRGLVVGTAAVALVAFLSGCRTSGDEVRTAAPAGGAVGAAADGPASTRAETPSGTPSAQETSAEPSATTSPAATSVAPATPRTTPRTTPRPTRKPRPSADADGRLEPGESGPAVLALQKSLQDQGFWLGTPDGGYGHQTTQAVMAFQKTAGLGRDGVAGRKTLAKIKSGTVRAHPTISNGIEINLSKQILMVVRGGRARYVVNTSTGSGEPFEMSGKEWHAVTPKGSYSVYRSVEGWRTSELGRLYRPRYFNGGIAVHGATSIPAHPASHGCARVSMAAMDLIWAENLMPMGSRVVVS